MNDYKITEELCQNSPIDVCRAIDLKTNDSVIIKQSSIKDLTTDKKLRNELDIIDSLDNNMILKPILLIPAGEEFIAVYEDIGISLEEYVLKFSVLPFKTFLRIAIQLSDILYYIHQNGILHTNIKPSSVIVIETDSCEEPKIRITDFYSSIKLSKNLSAIKTPEYIFEGSVDYASPEQLDKNYKYLDYRSDYYSLGVTLYKIFTQELPSQTENIKKSLKKMKLSEKRIFSSILGNLINKNIEKRYSNILYFKRELEVYLKELDHYTRFYSSKNEVRLNISQKIYGREKEAAIFLSTYRKATNGGKEILFVHGYSGIGKTLFITDTIKRNITKKSIFFIQVQLEQYTNSTPFNFFLQIVKNLIQDILDYGDIESWKNQISIVIGENIPIVLHFIPEMLPLFGIQKMEMDMEESEIQNRFNIIAQKLIGLFARKEHPVILFMDNFQWADTPSLNVIKNILIDSEINYLFLVAAYRDNEVTEEHPIFKFQKTLSIVEKRIYTIHLKPFSKIDIHNFICDTLKIEYTENIDRLIDILYSKVKGNPSFLKGLLKSLYKDNVIYFNYSNFKWEWKLGELLEYPVSEDVVDFIIETIDKLSINSYKILTIASYFGSEFSIGQLVDNMEEISSYEILDLIVTLIGEGFFISNKLSKELWKITERKKDLDSEVRNIKVQFRHDKIRQICYEMEDSHFIETQRLKIANYLIEQNDYLEQTDLLFKIVDHLNSASNLIYQPEELKKVINLNIVAANKSKLEMRFEDSLQYFRKAFYYYQKLWEEKDYWKEDFDLAYFIHIKIFELEFLDKSLSKTQSIFKIISYAKTNIQKAEILSIQISKYLLSFQYEEAITVGNKALSLLGITLLGPDILKEIQEYEFKLEHYVTEEHVDALYNYPDMDEPTKILSIHLLSYISSAAYFSGKMDLYTLIALKMIDMSLVYGNHPYTSFGYIEYSNSLIMSGHYKRAFFFGELGYKLSQKWDSTSSFQNASSYSVYANCIYSWKKSIRYCLSINNKGYKIGLESGNLIYTCYILFNISLSDFYIGTPLIEIKKELKKNLKIVRKYNHDLSINLLIAILMIVNNLSRRNEDYKLFEMNSIAESDYIKSRYESNDYWSICLYYTLKSQNLYLYKMYKEAYNSIIEAKKYLHYMSSLTTIVSSHNFYYSLILCSLYKEASDLDKLNYIQQINDNQKELKNWSDNCSENFLHKYFLVEAEIKRITLEYYTAAELYNLAIEEANKNNFIQIEALANELAGEFYLERNRIDLAEYYFMESIALYERWNSYSKLIQMYNRNKRLYKKKQEVISVNNQNKYFNEFSNSLDFNSIFKISNILAKETEYNKLIRKLILNLLYNSGAERVVLISTKNETTYINIEGTLRNIESYIGKSVKLDYYNIPFSLIQYVFRTKKYIILNNASEDKKFSKDLYISSNNIRSILCIPLFNKDIVYLEHNLIEGVFSKERIHIIENLVIQTVLSIENARLRSNIENIIKEKMRTEAEIEVIKQMQTSLMVKEPVMTGYEIQTYMKPAYKVTGDFYDVINNDDKDWLLIGDVSGHEVDAGLIMMMARTAIHTTIAGSDSIAEKLEKVNTVLSQSIEKMENSRQTELVIILREKDQFFYSGNHLSILIYRKSTNTIEELEVHGGFIGLSSSSSFQMKKFSMEKEDILFLYTDGLTESKLEKSEMNTDGLKKILLKICNDPTKFIKEKLKRMLKNYYIDDDITFMIIKKL